MDKYLKDDYGFIFVEDKPYYDNLEEYFEHDASAFDCGQGFYEDDVKLNVFYKEKAYLVHLTAEIVSAKQDRGDKLYWVESTNIESIKEIPIPQQKKSITKMYRIWTNKDNHKKIEAFLKSKGIEWNDN